MGILNLVSDIIKPITSLIGNIHTSDAERGQLTNALTKLENEMSVKLLDYESKLLESQTTIIQSEVQAQSWLQRNWRPLCMVVFLVLIVLHYLGLLAFEIADEMWTLLQIGIGGYVGARTVEKIVPGILDKVKK